MAFKEDISTRLYANKGHAFISHRANIAPRCSPSPPLRSPFRSGFGAKVNQLVVGESVATLFHVKHDEERAALVVEWFKQRMFRHS